MCVCYVFSAAPRAHATVAGHPLKDPSCVLPHVRAKRSIALLVAGPKAACQPPGHEQAGL